MKAKQMQAQYDAQNKRTIRQHSTKRRMLAGMAAAAAVLVGGAVTVGAANDWNYAAVFSKYFTEKSGDQVLYDFTGMGLDIGDTVEGDGYTLTIQSVMADATAVYIAYDIALSEETEAIIAPYLNGEINMCLSMQTFVFDTDENGTFRCYSAGGAQPQPVRDAEGIWHGVRIEEIEEGTELFDKQLWIRALYPTNLDGEMDPPLYIGYNYNDDDGMGDWMCLGAQDFDFCYDLADITVQEGITVPYGGTLPNDANENVFDTMTVTPFKLQFTLDRELGALDSIPEWGFTPGADAVDVTYTAVYADGTELTREAGLGSGSHTSGGTHHNPDGTKESCLMQSIYFSAPLDLGGLTAIRVNDIEIPVQ